PGGDAGRSVGFGNAAGDRHGDGPARAPAIPPPGGRGYGRGPARLSGRPVCGAGDHRMMTRFLRPARATTRRERTPQRPPWRSPGACVRAPARLAVAAVLALTLVSCAAGQQPSGGAGRPERVYFNTDVVPVLTKLGCNGGGCHGKTGGQNGFKLSLLGYEPDL